MARRTRPGDRGRKGVFRTTLGKSFEFDSLWERRRMQVLDLNGIRFQREGVRIPYLFDGKKRTYYPDFIVYDKFGKAVRAEEVKPSMRQSDPINMAKFQAAHLWCKERNMIFVVINEHNIDNPNPKL